MKATVFTKAADCLRSYEPTEVGNQILATRKTCEGMHAPIFRVAIIKTHTLFNVRDSKPKLGPSACALSADPLHSWS